MIDKPRSPGDLSLSGAVRSALAALCRATGQSARPELELERVREVEAAIGMHLPDDLLAVFAARVEHLETKFRMSLGMVIGHTGALRDHRARGDLVGVGQSGAREYLCLDKGAPTTADAHLLVYDVDDKTGRDLLLVDFLGARLRAVGAAASAGADPHFIPRLVQPMPESSMSGRRVRHPKFGEGKALREIGDGPTRKVQVDFPGWGLKLLQARFLEFLE
jgi:hypothetical protein